MFTFFRSIAVTLAGATLLGTGTAHAALLLGQEPDPALIVRTGDYEWVYASPCGGGADSCSRLLRHHRFDFATAAEWTSSFANLDALIAAFSVNGEPRCASTYFSFEYDHCDLSDLQIGAIWNSPFGNGVNESAAETFLVRLAEPSDVAEPASIGLIALGLAAVAATRRRRK
jgi:hypothetical protein